MSNSGSANDAEAQVRWAKDLAIIAKMLRTKAEGWGKADPVHGDSVRGDFITAANYVGHAGEKLVAAYETIKQFNMGEATTREAVDYAKADESSSPTTHQPDDCSAELALYSKVQDKALREELIRLYMLRGSSDGRNVDWKKEWRHGKREIERLRKMLLANGVDFRDGTTFTKRELPPVTECCHAEIVDGEMLCRKCGWTARATERESVAPGIDYGLPMEDIKVGMRLESTLGVNPKECVVTEITDKGFRYSCEPYYFRAGGVTGAVESGERFGADGWSFFREIEEQGRRG